MKSTGLIFLLTLTSLLIRAQDAKEIIRQADEKFRGTTAYSEMTMQIVRPSWTRSMSLKSWSKGSDYALILITAPARDKGTAFLKREGEIWNWVPSIERMIKLPPSMMMQSWMGSDFTNDDLVREASIVEDYTHKLTGEKTISGMAAYEITMIPKPEAPVVWSKVITYVSKEDKLFLRTEFYDEDNKLVNVMNYSDIKEMDGRKIPTRMEMIPQDKQGHKTVIVYEKMDFDVELDDSFFSQQQMKRIR